MLCIRWYKHLNNNKIRKIYKFAFHVEKDHNINYLMGWGLKTILSVDALKLSSRLRPKNYLMGWGLKTILRVEALKLSLWVEALKLIILRVEALKLFIVLRT